MVMFNNPSCPNCGKEIKDVSDKFVDRYDDGSETWVKCEHCFSIFKLTQHYIAYYNVNECTTKAVEYECGNTECESNSVNVMAETYAKLGKKNPASYCFHHAIVFPCRKYKPTSEMIELYEKDTGEKYVAPEG
jgi:hypothetical protein